MENRNPESHHQYTQRNKPAKKTGSSREQLRLLMREIGPFFCMYYIVITVLLLVQLPFTGTQSFSTWNFAGEGDDVYEINDKQDAEMVVAVNEDHLRGAAVDGFLNELNLIFTDEKMIMTVTDAETEELLTESVFMIVDQPLSKKDSTAMYFAFEDEIPKGTKVHIRLHSEGLANRGVFFEVSDEAMDENVTILDGEVSEQTLCLDFRYKVYRWNLLRPVLFYLIEAALGIFLLIINRRYRIAIWIKGKKESAEAAVRRDFLPLKAAAVIAVTALCMLVLAEFANWNSVSRISRRYDADMVYMDDYDLKTRIAVTDDAVVEQVIHTDKANFRGIGLAVQNNEDDEDPSKQSFYVSAKEKERLKDVSDTVKYVDGTLHVQVYDKETDELAADNEYEVGYLGSIEKVIAPGVKSKLVRNNQDSYVWLDFGKEIADSADRDYRIVITASDTGENGIRLSSSNRTNTFLTLDGEEKKTALCMVTLFDVNEGVSSWYFMIVAGMMIAVLGIGLLVHIFSVKIEYVFLVSALSMGLLFSLIVPPYCVPDERTHVDSIYRLSNQFLGINDIPGPSRIYKRACDVDASVSNTMSLSAYMYCDMSENLFDGAGENTDLVPAYARNAVDNVTVLNYLPGAFGFTIGRLLGRNLLTMIMMARWFNILVVSLLMFIAIRKVPFGKGVFAIIGLLPKMINQNISCSYDGMIIAAVYLFLAYSLYILYEEEISICELFVVTTTAWFLSCNKGGVYLPLLGLLVLLPYMRKKKKLFWAKITGCIYASVLLVYSFKFIVRISGILSRSSGSALKGEGQAVLYTLSDFFTDPGNLVRVFEKTAVIHGQNLMGDMFGINIAQQEVNAPWVVIIAFIILLVITSLARENDIERFSRRHKIFIMLFTAAGIGLISVSMLLSWTEKGSEIIEGLQGRYYLPYMILPFLCLQNRQIVRKKSDDQKLVWIADILLFITFCNLMISTFACAATGNLLT